MAENVKLGSYTPPPPPKGTIDIRIGVFFDGTQNNRKNTNARLGNFMDKEEKKTAADAYKKMSNHEDDSYMNDLSNVARKETHYAKNKYADSVYIEGIGTDDFGEDSDNPTNHLGVAFGSGTQGVIEKVKKGCKLIADKVKALKGKDKVNVLTLDVFGFSRGAAAARNFIYEVNKRPYRSKGVGSGVNENRTLRFDDHKQLVTVDDLPAHGELGKLLGEIKINKLIIRFVGLYDTVSSYDPNATNTTRHPDYNNDVAELHLNSLIAQKIIHFCANDEHRKNFMLTPTAKAAGGQDFYLPGVHSDVGGCYTDKMNESKQIMDFDNTIGDGYSDEDYNEILNNDLNDLIAQGWFIESQNEVTRPNKWHETHINRSGIRNTYSFVTLSLMSEKLNANYEGTIDITELNKYYGIPKPTAPDELDLNKVKERLTAYINGSQPKMEYYTNKQIEIFRKQEKEKKMATDTFNRIVKDHNMLIKLRRKYIHWNSMYGDIPQAYVPNFRIVGKTIVRSRLIERNS
ncbi:phospholipase effector Tle1 domain-containing protein [Pedobacter miscanthi]|jgi:hypothetical protein|uniref:phospholipase effector Tle1 domain-containing protein n=1 Tax=Pedobacter miscanthi TaxID=2259170 RepID=UPI002931BDC3|nr:DUF2235 domain-containing protein [Pedobacter miscanthi]